MLCDLLHAKLVWMPSVCFVIFEIITCKIESTLVLLVGLNPTRCRVFANSRLISP